MDSSSLPTPLFDSLQDLRLSLSPDILARIPLKWHSYAERDYGPAAQFLFAYRGWDTTFNAYRREVERLLLWSWDIEKKSILDLNFHEFEAYIAFCHAPPLAWIGTKQVPRFSLIEGEKRVNPAWRPFVAHVSKAYFQQGKRAEPKKFNLSAKSVAAIFAIGGSFYNFLIQHHHATHNPVSQIRQKSKFIRTKQTRPVIRRLSELQWQYVIDTAAELAKDQPEEHERTLFILHLLFAMYLRISELCSSTRWQPQMGHFFKDAEECWWFKTVGKGNKERLVSVSDAMLQSLHRYRRHLGLNARPSPGETTPLLYKQRGVGAITSTRQIRNIVQRCFDRAAEKLRAASQSEEAEQLLTATVHWLRHTGISEDVKIRPREHVRDDAGHSSSAITDKYIDIGLRERHASARGKPIKRTVKE